MVEVLNFFKVDRFALLQIFPNEKSWIITHSVSFANAPSVPVGTVLQMSINPWAYEKLVMKREVVSFSKIDDLPAEANVDKETWIEWGIRSNLNIPIMTGGPVEHIIVINSIKRECTWLEEFVPRLRLLGRSFRQCPGTKQDPEGIAGKRRAPESRNVCGRSRAMDHGHKYRPRLGVANTQRIVWISP